MKTEKIKIDNLVFECVGKTSENNEGIYWRYYLDHIGMPLIYLMCPDEKGNRHAVSYANTRNVKIFDKDFSHENVIRWGLENIRSAAPELYEKIINPPIYKISFTKDELLMILIALDTAEHESRIDQEDYYAFARKFAKQCNGILEDFYNGQIPEGLRVKI